MKTLKKILCLAALFAAGACSENDPVIFDDAFVYLTDANNLTASTVDQGGKSISTYYLVLVAPPLGQDIQVTYDLVVGDGLQADVDYRTVASTVSPVTIPAGIYRIPIRIEWLPHELDPARDNTLRIVLRGCDHPTIQLGRPGPARYGNNYTITKK